MSVPLSGVTVVTYIMATCMVDVIAVIAIIHMVIMTIHQWDTSNIVVVVIIIMQMLVFVSLNGEHTATACVEDDATVTGGGGCPHCPTHVQV